MDDFQFATPWHSDFFAKYFISGPSRVAKPVPVDIGLNKSQALLAYAKTENLINAPYSLMVNIPFCNQACQHQEHVGANSLSAEALEHYLADIDKEMAIFKPYFDLRPVKRLHIGGCTAALLDAAQLHQLTLSMRKNFEILADDIGHYSIDLDAMLVTEAQLNLIRELGFNHIRLCVQSVPANEGLGANLDNRFQHIKTLRRNAKIEQFDTVEVALAYGFPGQKPEVFADILELTCNLHPSRISLQPYTSRCNPDGCYPAMPVLDHQLASTLKLVEDSIARITRSGYRQIGIDLFARKNDPLFKAKQQGTLTKGLLGYSPTKQQDVLGLGASGVTCLGNLVAQNTAQTDIYSERINAQQPATDVSYRYDTHDRIRAAFVSHLICQGTVVFDELDRDFDIDSRSYLTDRIAELDLMVEDGLIELDDDGLNITKTGELLLRPICMVLDHWMQKRGPNFS